MSLHLEDEVREALQSGTAHLTTPWDTYARVMETVAAHRRRRRAVVAWAGVATLALAGVIGVAAGFGDQPSHRSTPATEELSPPQITRWGLPFSWPARGDLGTDPEFANEFDRRLGSNHHLLYAEDGDAGRVVIAVSSAQEAVVFHGPRGAGLEELERAPGLPADSRHVVVALPQDDGHLIIALMPGNLGDAQLSTPEWVARDGSVQRSWQQIPVEQGVGHVFTSEPLGVIRVLSAVGAGPPTVVVGDADRPPGTLACGRCDRAWFATEALAEFHAQAAAAVGTEAEDVTAQLVVDLAIPSVSGTQGSGEDSPGRVVSYVATMPSGGLLRSTYVTTPGPGGPTVAMVEPLRPLPARDGDRPVFVPPRIVGPALIIAPGSSRVTFSPLRGAAPLADATLTDGVGVIIDSPEDLADYTITVHGSDGGVLGTWHGSLMQSEDPFDGRPEA